MNVGVLGTGMVGEAIASKLVSLGHAVAVGSRTADNPAAARWARGAGSRARAGTFADAAAFGDVLFNCTRGAASLSALHAAGAQNLSGKVLIDVANVLPPDDRGPQSLGERIQDAFPAANVVKALNTINCDVMVNPASVAGRHTAFVSGNDAGAKRQTIALLESFGWVDIIDLGDITTARATEAYLSLWVVLWRKLGTAAFNVSVVR
ncbi:MAG: NADPH-dependent F420 reductase [Vicinamibacteraceae bacterium]